MLGVAFLFTACISTITINANPLRDEDLNTIIKVLQSRVENDKISEELSSTSAGDDSHNLGERNLKTKDVIDLIQQAKMKKAVPLNSNDRHRVKIGPYSANQYYQNQNEPSNNNLKNNRLIDRLLEQLTRQERNPNKNLLIPNRLIDPIESVDVDGLEQNGGANDYSKIFVVLDPTALQNSRNKDVSSLVSRIISQSLSAIDKSRQNKLHRYNGFVVKNGSRRYKKDSKEMYGSDGGGGGRGAADLEDDYRPKRPRASYGGSGGAGRTAIPYIRNRGDIYERDH